MRKKKKRSSFWNGVFFTLFVIGVIIIFGKFFLPGILAKRIMEDENMKNSVAFFQSQNIPEEKALNLVNDIEKKEVANAFKVVADKELLTEDDKLLFLKEMGIEEQYYPTILKKMKAEDLKKAAEKYEQNKERIQTFFPLIKKTLLESIKKMNDEEN